MVISGIILPVFMRNKSVGAGTLTTRGVRLVPRRLAGPARESTTIRGSVALPAPPPCMISAGPWWMVSQGRVGESTTTSGNVAPPAPHHCTTSAGSSSTVNYSIFFQIGRIHCQLANDSTCFVEHNLKHATLSQDRLV